MCSMYICLETLLNIIMQLKLYNNNFTNSLKYTLEIKDQNIFFSSNSTAKAEVNKGDSFHSKVWWLQSKKILINID